MFQLLYDKIRLLFVKDKESYLLFYRLLGFYPRRMSYYKVALRHKSYHNRKGITLNNERMEFLGDAVLDAIVADIVFRHFKKQHEGKLTNIRSRIVQRDTLGKLAEKIGIPELLQKSSQPILTHNKFIYGNAFEALMGAIYLDRGYEQCMTFFKERIMDKYIDLEKVFHQELNFKSHLLEWGQKYKIPIEFRLVNQTPVNNSSDITFESEVLAGGISSGKGSGYTKKESEQKAAKEALTRIRNNKEFKQMLLSLNTETTEETQETPKTETPETETPKPEPLQPDAPAQETPVPETTQESTEADA